MNGNLKMNKDIIEKIEIITAYDVSKEKIEKFAFLFAQKLGIDSYRVESKIDEDIVDGIIVFAGDFRYDYSVKGKLDRILDTLKSVRSKTGSSPKTEDISDIIHKTLCDAVDNCGDICNVISDVTLEPKAGLKAFNLSGYVDEVGRVISVGDSIANVSGLKNCRNGELIKFTKKTLGIAMNLEEEIVKVVLIGDIDSVYEGMICIRTQSTIEVPAGKSVLGRVVNSLGEPLDGLGPISDEIKRPVEFRAPGIVERSPVNKSLHTGIIAIDSMVPIGRGQRELIIGDRQTGKTTIALDTILNQRGKNVYCIYVAIAQKMSTIVSVVETLRNHNAMSYTTVVAAGAGEGASMQYIAPYAGCAMAEELMYSKNADVLIVYDDLTKHAQAYRALSLLLKRPPGREAYPGDVFYLHSRLLERAARLSDDLGGGSITALPIAETQVGDISGYIPTNLISITDGQIYLEEQLFLSGQRPAINVGLSVSRVGGSAQSPAMKKVCASMRINMAQYKELEAFSQFGSELDESTRARLIKGHNLFEILKQEQHSSMKSHEQVLILYLANTNKFCSFFPQDIMPFFKMFMEYLNSIHPEVVEDIISTDEFTDKTRKTVDLGFGEYYQLWKAQMEDYGTDI